MTKEEVIYELELKYAAEHEEYKKQYDSYHSGAMAAIDEAIQTVEKLDDPGQNWIPCSERLPNEYDSVFAKLIGTDKWNNAMFRRRSDDVNVTVELEDGTRKTMTMHTTDGKWKHNYLAVRFEVIAWKPLPEPYKVGEQE